MRPPASPRLVDLARAELHAWYAMCNRCDNEYDAAYPRYGAIGVRVCSRWFSSFENFVSDMGPRPDKHELDRWPDPYGNYEPGNCRWATKSQQQRNQRNAVLVDYNDEWRHLKDLAEESRINYQVVYGRVNLGWDLETALATPVIKRKKRDLNVEFANSHRRLRDRLRDRHASHRGAYLLPR